jgi:hypothetical protein
MEFKEGSNNKIIRRYVRTATRDAKAWGRGAANICDDCGSDGIEELLVAAVMSTE